MATKKEIYTEDTRWKTKGHAHKELDKEPEICPYCWGHGHYDNEAGLLVECFTCQGTGEVYD